MDACGEFFLPAQGLFKVGLGGCLHFPSDEAATKLMWLALRNIMVDSGRSVREWRQAMNQFAIAFGDRFTRYVV